MFKTLGHRQNGLVQENFASSASVCIAFWPNYGLEPPSKPWIKPQLYLPLGAIAEAFQSVQTGGTPGWVRPILAITQ